MFTLFGGSPWPNYHLETERQGRVHDHRPGGSRGAEPMIKEDISQLPLVDGKDFVGSLGYSRLLENLIDEPLIQDKAVHEITTLVPVCAGRYHSVHAALYDHARLPDHHGAQ
ncbi:MAG: hypothetical protein OXF73_02270 [Gammaproteobacteria bacterium]|nr:hypothetical protein [Gammaproteobacteria bacterium]